MSRSGYSDECNGWDLIRWRGAVNSAIKGARGQDFLRETLAALDAMPVKRLIADELVTRTGEHCVLGVIGAARGLPLEQFDLEDTFGLSKALNIADSMAKEIVSENDDRWHGETPEHRWTRIRQWVAVQIKEPT